MRANGHRQSLLGGRQRPPPDPVREYPPHPQSACRQLLENIQYLLGDRPLDYLVINHMEPDHGASIEEILLRYPEVQVISTEKAFMLMRQFGFHLEGHGCIQVQEGDTFSFGSHKVTFIGAPMVHWPEAMVTFDSTNGALFSADAFGSFIALDGKLFADEVNFDRDWIDEARRYLTNIVGKYGPHIQLLLKKAGGILDQIKFICPLHGPVWRKDLGYFIDKYDKWSRYEPEVRGVLIVYASMYGNTEAAAQALAARLCEKGITDVALYDLQIQPCGAGLGHLQPGHLPGDEELSGGYEGPEPSEPHLRPHRERVLGLQVGRPDAEIPGRRDERHDQFLEEEMKDMTVLNERLSLASSMLPDKAAELDKLADALAESLQEQN